MNEPVDSTVAHHELTPDQLKEEGNLVTKALESGNLSLIQQTFAQLHREKRLIKNKNIREIVGKHIHTIDNQTRQKIAQTFSSLSGETRRVQVRILEELGTLSRSRQVNNTGAVETRFTQMLAELKLSEKVNFVQISQRLKRAEELTNENIYSFRKVLSQLERADQSSARQSVQEMITGSRRILTKISDAAKDLHGLVITYRKQTEVFPPEYRSMFTLE